MEHVRAVQNAVTKRVLLLYVVFFSQHNVSFLEIRTKLSSLSTLRCLFCVCV